MSFIGIAFADGLGVVPEPGEPFSVRCEPLPVAVGQGVPNRQETGESGFRGRVAIACQNDRTNPARVGLRVA